MKKVLYWLMGDKAGRTIVGAWNWMWGLPVESGGQVSVAVAEESLRSMQESVQKLAAVSTQVTAYQRAKTKYEEKVREMQTVERQAITAKRHGNEEAARLAMAKVIGNSDRTNPAAIRIPSKTSRTIPQRFQGQAKSRADEAGSLQN
ncbi:hypothetical protein [Microcoleus sp. AT3-D2]|uniref:hypothetical protein n=1 Tax=Microcoleus sp. AT3-D2 TaxID=2818612 RepID=UPI002FD17BA5